MREFESGNIGAAEFVARSTVLDADSKAVVEAPTASDVTSEQAWSYMNDLASTFADADEQERSDLIHALYGRVDVLRPDIVSATLTPDAESYALALALPQEVRIEQPFLEQVAMARPEGFEPPTC